MNTGEMMTIKNGRLVVWTTLYSLLDGLSRGRFVRVRGVTQFRGNHGDSLHVAS